MSTKKFILKNGSVVLHLYTLNYIEKVTASTAGASNETYIGAFNVN